MSFVKNLDTPLLKMSERDTLTLRDCCAGVHFFGGIGSGKTSGSGRALAAEYRAGGGIVVGPIPNAPASFDESEDSSP